MIIIDQWYKSHLERVRGAIEIEETDDGKYDVIIEDKIMASVDDKKTADTLVSRIEHFVNNYRRSVDTFDICQELKLIKDNTDNKESGYGSYFS